MKTYLVSLAGNTPADRRPFRVKAKSAMHAMALVRAEHRKQWGITLRANAFIKVKVAP